MIDKLDAAYVEIAKKTIFDNAAFRKSKSRIELEV